jgi:tetratricopeptide (TPR) repeat protein
MRRYAILATVLFATAIAALAQQAAPGGKQMKPKSKGEEAAIRALLSAPDLDGRIKAADELITKFADTEFKAFALYTEADAYAQKGDSEKAIVYAEQTLVADPKNYQAQVLLAKMYAQSVKPTDLDKQEKLTKAAKYGNDALASIATAEKPNPQLTDAQWTEMKNDFMGQAHFALGVSAAYANKADEVTEHFNKVAELDADPVDLIRAGRVMLDLKKPAAAVPWFEKALAAKDLQPQVKQIAESDLARAKSAAK